MYKIGIITYHYHYNYGTMLQALALQKVIESLGFESEIINFKKIDKLNIEKLILLRIKRSFVYLKNIEKYYILNKYKNNLKLRNSLFDDFYFSEIKVGKIKYETTRMLMDNPPEYDAYIVGSDQTWNPYASGRPEAFYLPFVKDNLKKGSYAPSLAINNLTKEQEKFIVKHLKDFSYLSCREKTGSIILSNLLKRSVETVLDPTLLLSSYEWLKYSNNNFIPKEDYMLVYFLGENIKHREIVKNLSKKLSLKIKALPITYLEMKNKHIEKEFVGPKEFLILIKNAKLICTDSFHGTIFSINFEKDFYSFCKMNKKDKKSENSRLLDALKEFGLENRMISTTPDKIEKINYKIVKEILEKKRKESKEYLLNMLENLIKGGI